MRLCDTTQYITLRNAALSVGHRKPAMSLPRTLNISFFFYALFSTGERDSGNREITLMPSLTYLIQTKLPFCCSNIIDPETTSFSEEDEAVSTEDEGNRQVLLPLVSALHVIASRYV